MSGYLPAHRKSLIAAIGLVVTLTQQILPHWPGTAGVTAAAAALTWVLVHEVPNAPSSSSPSLTPEALLSQARQLYAELSASLVASSTTAAAAPSSPTTAAAAPSSPTSSSSSP